ncbi:hypothetical protein [Ferruginibacter sp.]
MKKKYKIILILLLLSYPCYKGFRELFWVEHYSYTINNSLEIKLRIDPDITGFQDFDIDKTITLFNKKTQAKNKISFTSLEPGLYFSLDNTDTPKILSIADRFAGQNTYNYATLQLTGSKDCLTEYGNCEGFRLNYDSLYLIYDDKGLHKY